MFLVGSPTRVRPRGWMKLMEATAAAVLRRHAHDRPSAPALIYDDRLTTWAELDELSTRVANGLLEDGVAQGARIGYLGRNCDRYFEILYGAAKAGAVLVPINWRLTPGEIDFILRDSEIDVLFVSEEFLLAAENTSTAGSDRRVFVVDGVGEHSTAYEEWRDRSGSLDPRKDDENADVVVVYTSGTTGRPKGAVITHGYLFAGLRTVLASSTKHMEWATHEMALVTMPLFHIGGIAYSFAGAAQGCALVIQREFSSAGVLAAVGQYDIPTLVMVPAMIQAVIDDPAAPKTDFSRVRYVSYGAAPIPRDLLLQAIDVFGCQFVQTYGMTESTYLTFLPPEDHSPHDSGRMRSVGRAFPGVSITILDTDGQELSPGEFGEIAVRAPAMLRGYWKQPEATAERFTDGWFRTGDGGYLDDDGYLFLGDRINDMIVSGGENIYPAEVENALYSHPTVHEVAVVGVPDQRWGEVPKAFIVLHPGERLDPDSLTRHAGALLARYKVPKHFEAVDVLPRTASGKVMRRKLRERA